MILNKTQRMMQNYQVLVENKVLKAKFLKIRNINLSKYNNHTQMIKIILIHN